MYGWYARPVRQDGEDTWVRMADETTSNAVYNWDLNWACVKEAPPMSDCPGKFRCSKTLKVFNPQNKDQITLNVFYPHKILNPQKF